MSLSMIRTGISWAQRNPSGGTISHVTAVDEAILSGESLADRSIAQRMSWAAGRKTNRIEDRAHSVLGIFGVYMPKLFGEVENASLRLQQEITRQSDDHSIFVTNLPNRIVSIGVLQSLQYSLVYNAIFSYI